MAGREWSYPFSTTRVRLGEIAHAHEQGEPTPRDDVQFLLDCIARLMADRDDVRRADLMAPSPRSDTSARTP